jgi:hypothetical protein
MSSRASGQAPRATPGDVLPIQPISTGFFRLSSSKGLLRGFKRSFYAFLWFGRKMGMGAVFVYMVGAWLLFHNWRWPAFTSFT